MPIRILSALLLSAIACPAAEPTSTDSPAPPLSAMQIVAVLAHADADLFPDGHRLRLDFESDGTTDGVITRDEDWIVLNVPEQRFTLRGRIRDGHFQCVTEASIPLERLGPAVERDAGGLRAGGLSLARDGDRLVLRGGQRTATLHLEPVARREP